MSKVLDYNLEHVMSFTVTLHPPEVIGPVSEGLRVNFYVASGEVNGPKVYGKLRPVGGDALTVRTDGVAILNVRNTRGGPHIRGLHGGCGARCRRV